MQKRLLLAFGAALIFAVPTPLSAGVPHLINFQGRITNSSGVPLDTTITVGLAIYTAASGGSTVWSESQPAATVTDGSCDILMGAINPIPDSVFADTTRWLGVTVGSEPEMSPRIRLVSGPYSYRVGTVDGASGGTVKSGLTVNGQVSVEGFRMESGASAGQVLTSDAVGNGTWQPGTPGPQGPPGPANTLDMAYDQGGPGEGRVIEADAGPVEIYSRDTVVDGQLQDALAAVTSGEGRAIVAYSNSLIGGDAIVAWTGGNGRAILAHSDVTASGDAIVAVTTGEGRAILAYSDPTSPADVVDAIAYGAGNAGRFVAVDTSSVAAGIVGESQSGRETSAGVRAIGGGLSATGLPAAAALEICNGAIRVTGENKPVGKLEFGPGQGPGLDPCGPQCYTLLPLENTLITGSSFIFLSVECPEGDCTQDVSLSAVLFSQGSGSATVRVYQIAIGPPFESLPLQHGYVHYLIINP